MTRPSAVVVPLVLVQPHVSLWRSIGDEPNQTSDGKAAWSINYDHLCPPNLPGPSASGLAEWLVRVPEHPLGLTPVKGCVQPRWQDSGNQPPFANGA